MLTHFRWNFVYLSVFFISITASHKSQAARLSLQEFLQNAIKNNTQFAALKSLEEAAKLTQEKGDIELTPMLSLKMGIMDDKKPTLQPNFQGDHTQAKQIQLGVAKKFSTGTALQVQMLHNWAQISGTTFPLPTYWSPALSIGFSQSLWKDFLGRQTQIRRDRENAQEKLQSLVHALSGLQLLFAMEQSYWNHIFYVQDLRIKKESLLRAQKLKTWMARRVNNGLADRNDLLQVEALEGARMLQLITAEDEYQASIKTLELSMGQSLAGFEIPSSFPSSDNFDIPKDFLRIDVLIQQRESQMRSYVVKETIEATKPELNLAGSASTNAQKSTLAGSFGGLLATDKPTYILGIELKIDLDSRSKNAIKNSALAESTAAVQKLSHGLIEGQIQREELLRRANDLNVRIQTVEKLLKIHAEKSAREKDRLERGRTVTFQVINFEQEHSESEVLLLKLQSEKQKLLASRRLFVSENFGD